MKNRSHPCLLVMSGLPGTGKSTVAEGMARAIGAPIVSVDPIEAAMWTSGLAKEETGLAAYYVARAIASENLLLGQSVIVDAVNPVNAARKMWRKLSEHADAQLIFIEVRCSDETIHRQRIEARVRGIEGMSEVTWDRVQKRKAEYEPWNEPRLKLDSARLSSNELIASAVEYLNAY